MKKTYLKLFALATMLVTAMTASAQYTTEIETGMFKAWDSPDPGANEVAPEEAGTDEGPFECFNNMYQELGAGGLVYGHHNVYYLWYADVTGTESITFTGTPGVQLRVLMNRPAPEEGGTDSHGGTTVERNVTIGDDGKATVEVGDLAYVHINAIKLGWGSPAGKIRNIELYGSVQGSGEKHEPIDMLSAGYQNDVVCVSLSNTTNLSDLMGRSKRLIFPKDCASVKVNGQLATLMSVEGMEGNKLFIFIDEGYPEGEDDEVLVSFTNPSSPHLKFVDGRFEGQDVPSFTDMKAEYQDGLGEYYSYLAAKPELVSATPEDGSFNLPETLNRFVLEFTANVNCEEVQATLGGEPLTISPSTGFANVLTLTYNGGNLNGEYELHVTNIKPEMDFLQEVGEVTLSYSFGPVDISGDVAKELLSADAFESCAVGGIPVGYIVNFNGEERTSDGSYGSGPRIMSFGAGGDFTKGLYIREGYCETEEPLEFEAGKKYSISFNSARWKASGATMKFEIIDENEVAVFEQTINNEPDVNGSQAAVSGSTFTSIKFVPEYDGNYRLRWTADGWTEVLLANVAVKYVPSTIGAEWIQLVSDAIANAQKVLEDNSEERYQGAATATLANLIQQYSDLTQFTGPGACQAAADALNAGIQAVKDHRATCDEYDSIIKKAIDVERQNARPDGDPAKATKFTKTDLFAQVVDVVAKYHGSSEWENLGDEENPRWQLNYSYDVLTDENQLQSAIAEISAVTNTAIAMFTNGPSKCNMTGYGVITERMRLGVETLKALGVGESSLLIKEASGAFDDDDQIAAKLKDRVMRRLYNTLNDPNNTLFEEKVDEATMESYVDPLDMTVFVKNSNIYRTSSSDQLTPENIPGWVTPEGFAKPGYTTGWSVVGGDGIPADGMFSNWGGSFRVEQAITDLPAGTYTVRVAVGERVDDESNVDSRYYIWTTTTDSLWQQPSVIGQSYPVAASGSSYFENVVITDGKLTVGVNAGNGSHVFFNEVIVEMTGPAPGFSYPKMEEVNDETSAVGDVNGDGAVNVADISAIIDHMAGIKDFGAAADVNGDQAVNVADISSVIDIMAANARRALLLLGKE